MKLSLSHNPCNLYILLWCLYLVQGMFGPAFSLIFQAIILIILFISLTHVLEIIKSGVNNTFFMWSLVLILFYTVHGVILLIEGGTTAGFSNVFIARRFLQSFYMSILPIFSFYYYAKRGYLTVDIIRKWSFVFVVVAIAVYFIMQREALLELMDSGSGREEVTNNAGYVVVALIPLAFALSKRCFQFILIGIAMLFALFSMKRGAILTGAVATILFIHFTINSKSMNFSRRVGFLLLIIVGCFGVSLFLRDTLFQSDYFQLRVQNTLEGNTSLRDELVKSCLKYYKNDATIIQQIFGSGPNGTLSVTGNGAHNDWLELLVNQGLIGAVVFLCFWISFFRMTVNKHLNTMSRHALIVVFTICFLRTLFSQSINDISIFLSIVMGFAMSNGFSEMTGDNHLVTTDMPKMAAMM